MAKLSARGRTEIFRATRYFEGRRDEVAYMSDRVILSKTTTYPDGKAYSQGWKRVGRLNKNVSFDDAKAKRQQLGYTVKEQTKTQGE